MAFSFQTERIICELRWIRFTLVGLIIVLLVWIVSQ